MDQQRSYHSFALSQKTDLQWILYFIHTSQYTEVGMIFNPESLIPAYWHSIHRIDKHLSSSRQTLSENPVFTLNCEKLCSTFLNNYIFQDSSIDFKQESNVIAWRYYCSLQLYKIINNLHFNNAYQSLSISLRFMTDTRTCIWVWWNKFLKLNDIPSTKSIPFTYFPIGHQSEVDGLQNSDRRKCNTKIKILWNMYTYI